MKIILLQNVENLGHAGETVNARDGYFRNYLSPRKLAVLPTEGGIRFLESKRKQALLKLQHLKESAVKIAAELEKTTCVVQAKVGQEGKLFGSVNAQDVHEYLEKQGISIERKRIELAPIHQVGDYHAKIKLHPEVDVTLKISVKA